MPIRLYERGLTTTGAMDESTTATLQVPRDRNISVLGLDVTCTIANGAMAASTLTPRQLFSIFDKISVNVNGSAGTLANIEGGCYYDHIKYMMDKEPRIIDNEVPIDRNSNVSIAASSSEVVRFMIPIFFRNDINNDLDMSCLLDASALSSLEVEYTTRSGWAPANTDLTLTGASSNVRLWLKEVYGTPDEIAAQNAANGYKSFYNVFYRQQRNLSLVSSSSMAQSFDLLTGYVHQGVSFHSFDASAVDWVNDIVDRVNLKQTGTTVGDVDHFLEDWEQSQFEDGTEVRAAPSKGMTMWDAGMKLGGLDARYLKQGDLKLFYNTGGTFASGDGLSALYRSLLPAETV